MGLLMYKLDSDVVKILKEKLILFKELKYLSIKF